MCGISGFLAPRLDRSADELTSIARRMARAQTHRGPDDEGVWVDERAGVALSHRRLSIVDLSALGHQPMSSAAGRFIVTFNGELYNYRQLREDLLRSGAKFHTESDTEVLLAAIEAWGITDAAQRFRGMYAFAVWDRRDRRLHLLRDRMGEKPLYYGWSRDVFLFGSELKSLRAHPAWSASVDRDAVASFLRLSYVPAPLSIFSGVCKLPAGSMLTVDPSDRELPSAERYWTVPPLLPPAEAERFAGDDDVAANQLERLLSAAVGEQMVADVPVGAFLSGGIDSSTVVALMQSHSPRPVRTFSIGFAEAGYDEAQHAGAVAKHLGTHHTELYVSPREAMDIIPSLPGIYDEPFADSSQIPTHIVSRLARSSVTVSLSGDGGDELFGGYRRYVLAPRIWQSIRWLPPRGRLAASRLLGRIPADAWSSPPGGLLGRAARRARLGENAAKLAALLRASERADVYESLVSSWREPSTVVRGGAERRTARDTFAAASGDSFVEAMMRADALTYLPDDILVKVDRAAMAVGLETRVPFLDQRVVEFAWKLPLRMRIRDGVGKWLLRQVLYRHVPAALVERPKMGFGVPVGQWIRGPLRGWAEDLLDERRLQDAGYFDPRPIRDLWTAHLRGTRDGQFALWSVLMFQAWLEEASRPPTLS